MLHDSTTYVVCALAVDAHGNLQTEVTSSSFDTPDGTPPVLKLSATASQRTEASNLEEDSAGGSQCTLLICLWALSQHCLPARLRSWVPDLHGLNHNKHAGFTCRLTAKVVLDSPEAASIYGQVVVVTNSSAGAVLGLSPQRLLGVPSTWPESVQTSVVALQEFEMPGGSFQVYIIY